MNSFHENLFDEKKGMIFLNALLALSSESVKITTKELLQKILDILGLDPSNVIDIIKQIKELPSAVRDDIFFESLQAYILKLNNYDSEKKAFIEDNLHKMSVRLAEATPNEKSEYEGNPDKLHEYSKRIVKLIDDCGTVQKAVYLANISRALAEKELNTRDFFKLGQCIRMLTEEDLLFLKKNIREGTMNDIEYIDDFRGLGLMYEIDGGFAYSLKAFYLLKYGLDYEGNVHIPEKFPERNIISFAGNDEVNDMFKL